MKLQQCVFWLGGITFLGIASAPWTARTDFMRTVTGVVGNYSLLSPLVLYPLVLFELLYLSLAGICIFIALQKEDNNGSNN